MSIFGNDLDRMIDSLEQTIPDVDAGFSCGFEVEHHDWRPVWNLCREIQDTFRGYKGYSSREEHQAAWERFQELRQKASELADIEKAKFADQSNRIKDRILYDAHHAYWSMSSDALLGPLLGDTTIEELQGLQSILKEAGRRLSQNKHLMLKSDKEECFEAIKEARESHDRFYEKYREMKGERREASQRKREEFERKRDAWRARTSANISKNEDKLERAKGALERTRERISEIEAKLTETTSDKWEGIFSEWLEEAQDKEADIEASMERIEGWIDEDQQKLNDSYD